MARVYAVEHRVLTDVLAAGGTFLSDGPIPDIVEDRTRRTRARNIAEAGYELTLPRSSPLYASLLQERVIWVAYSDGSIEEWRIRRIEEATEGDSGTKLARVRCRHVGLDLQYRSEIMEKTDGGLPHIDFEHTGPPSEHFGIILGTLGAPFVTGKAPSHFVAGTIAFTDDITIRYRGLRPWEAFTEIERQTGGEIFVRRNGATNWPVDLVVSVNSSVAPGRIELGVNAAALEHQADSDDQATVVTPRGDRHPSATADEGFELTIAENAFEVEAVAGNDLTLSHDIVVEDDALNGLWAFDADGNGNQVTDSTAPNVITVPGHAIAVEETVAIRKNSSGDRIIRIDYPSKATAFGTKGKLYDRPDIPHVNNVLPNPWLRDWTDGGYGNPFFLPPPPTPLLPQPRAPNPLPFPRNRPRLGPAGGGAASGIARTAMGSGGGDAFARADAATLGGSWFDPAGVFPIVSQHAECIVNGFAVFMGGGTRNEFVVRADVAAKSGEALLILKWLNAGNWVVGGIVLVSGNQRLRILQAVSGTVTTLADTDITDDTSGSHVLKGWIRSGAVDLWYDGSTNISGTPDASLGTGYGFCGLYGGFLGSGTQPQFDNFRLAVTNVITCTGLATGEKMDIDGNQTTESGGTATWSLGGTDWPLTTIELLDSGGSPLVPPSGPWSPPYGGIAPGDQFAKV